MIRVFIAEDHAIFRAGLRQVLALGGDFTVAAEASAGAQLLELLRSDEPDLVVLDMEMPGLSGTDLVARLRAHYPRLPVLVLSAHNEPHIARRVLKAGAAGYFTKDSEPELLLAAARKVAAGGRFIASHLAEQIAFGAIESAGGRPHDRLTDREFEVLQMLARGASVNEAAEQLAISSKTVSTHKARLMQKMDMRTNAELIRYAVIHGLA